MNTNNSGTGAQQGCSEILQAMCLMLQVSLYEPLCAGRQQANSKQCATEAAKGLSSLLPTECFAEWGSPMSYIVIRLTSMELQLCNGKLQSPSCDGRECYQPVHSRLSFWILRMGAIAKEQTGIARLSFCEADSQHVQHAIASQRRGVKAHHQKFHNLHGDKQGDGNKVGQQNPVSDPKNNSIGKIVLVVALVVGLELQVCALVSRIVAPPQAAASKADAEQDLEHDDDSNLDIEEGIIGACSQGKERVSTFAGWLNTGKELPACSTIDGQTA